MSGRSPRTGPAHHSAQFSFLNFLPPSSCLSRMWACAFIIPYPVIQIVLRINTGPASGTQSRELPLQVPQPVLYAGTNYMQFNQPVNFLIGQARYLFIQARTGGGGGNWGMKCSISGQLAPSVSCRHAVKPEGQRAALGSARVDALSETP